MHWPNESVESDALTINTAAVDTASVIQRFRILLKKTVTAQK
jgi:hypothetical protein